MFLCKFPASKGIPVATGYTTGCVCGGFSYSVAQDVATLKGDSDVLMRFQSLWHQ